MAELADIFRLHGPEYLAAFSDRLPAGHKRAMRDIAGCRTPVFGGSLHACPHCPDILTYSYHSCGNRSCPKCQNGEASDWIAKQAQLLLPTRYFLVTVTLPEECRAVARSNQRAVYDAFFRGSAQAILGLCGRRKHLGGLAGLMGVLQTWRRDMGYHPHIHFVVPGGALSPDGARWITPRYRDWLIPEKALAALVKLRFKEELAKLGLLAQVPPAVWKRDKKWVANCIPAGTGEAALKYLSAYIFRAAITNNRIERDEGGKVTYRYKDGKSGRWQHHTVPAAEFIRLFLQHVLPRGFVKVRYYGFLAAKNRKAMLPPIRELLAAARNAGAGKADAEPPAPAAANPHKHEFLCPRCHAVMVLVARIPRQLTARAPPPSPAAEPGRAA